MRNLALTIGYAVMAAGGIAVLALILKGAVQLWRDAITAVKAAPDELRPGDARLHYGDNRAK